MPVNPHTKTVKWRMTGSCLRLGRWFLGSIYLGALTINMQPNIPKTILGISTAISGGKPPFTANTNAKRFTTMYT
jgi:hypothetical protein